MLLFKDVSFQNFLLKDTSYCRKEKCCLSTTKILGYIFLDTLYVWLLTLYRNDSLRGWRYVDLKFLLLHENFLSDYLFKPTASIWRALRENIVCDWLSLCSDDEPHITKKKEKKKREREKGVGGIFSSYSKFLAKLKNCTAFWCEHVIWKDWSYLFLTIPRFFWINYDAFRGFSTFS